MFKKFNVITFLAIMPMLFIPATVGFVSMMAIESEKVLFEQTFKQLEVEHVEKNVTAMRSKVDSLADLASYRKSLIDIELQTRIKRRVDEAYNVANSIHAHLTNGQEKVSDFDIQEIIKSALRPLVWNEGESFIWILDFEGTFHLAPSYLRHLEGSSIIDFKDATGRDVIKEEILIVKERGEGFMWDTFTRPTKDPNTQYEQLAFVKNFGHYDWYFGSSEYLDIATKSSDKKLLKAISKIDQASVDEMFIFDSNGILLLSPAYPEKVGTNLSELVDGQLMTTKKAFQYEWLEGISRVAEAKHVYVKNVLNTDWIIGSVIYDVDLKAELIQAQNSLIQRYNKRISNMKSVSVWSFVLAIFTSLLLSVSVHNLLVRYKEALANKNRELQVLNATLEEKVSLRTHELEAVNVQLERLATTDSLTGAQNRYAFMKAIESEVKRSDRYGEHFSLIMFDLDFFKTVNDQFGHDVGDQALITIVNLMDAALRDVDVFCRFGGEEFIVLMPCTNIKAAEDTAERLRVMVENHYFNNAGHLTISLGVVEHLKNELVDTALKRVDLALYQSKDRGRNKVSVLKS